MNCHLVPLFRTWKKLERKLEQPPQRQSDKGLWQSQTYPESSGGLVLRLERRLEQTEKPANLASELVRGSSGWNGSWNNWSCVL